MLLNVIDLMRNCKHDTILLQAALEAHRNIGTIYHTRHEIPHRQAPFGRTRCDSYSCSHCSADVLLPFSFCKAASCSSGGKAMKANTANRSADGMQSQAGISRGPRQQGHESKHCKQANQWDAITSRDWQGAQAKSHNMPVLVISAHNQSRVQQAAPNGNGEAACSAAVSYKQMRSNVMNAMEGPAKSLKH
eukprot:1156071-Pelagomonas_calceolata.AAC.5